MGCRLLFTCAVAFVAVPSSAWAGPTGGASYAGAPSISAVICVDGRASACAAGADLTVSGAALDGVQRVVFLGGKGHGDDRVARPTTKTDERLVVTVPGAAHTGPLILETGRERVRSPRLKVTPRAAAPAPAAPPTVPGAEVFPIAGAHTYGASTANRFGGGHQGQDVFAACGTPLVAIGDGTVLKAAAEKNAGNYAVIQRADGTSNTYMHMRDPALVDPGAPVTAGQSLGVVGETGRASGCHLHFELWTAPGWYRGGKPVDPLVALRGWDTKG